MTKAAREAAFDEERNDALRRRVGLLLPRQERRSSLAPLHSHVVGQASLGRLEAFPVHELTLEQLEREERPRATSRAGYSRPVLKVSAPMPIQATEDAKSSCGSGNDRQHVPKWQTSGGRTGRRSPSTPRSLP